MITPKRLVCYVLAAGALWFLGHSAYIIADGLHDRIVPSDVIVVLGNRVERSGVPSLRLQERLRKALELYQQGLAPRIIVSGGLGREGFDEAEVMKAYLAERGVPPEAIIADSDGYDTYRTAANASRIMAGLSLRSAIAVSQYYHLPRARLALARAGVRSVSSAHAEVVLTWREPYVLFREFVAYYYYLLRTF